MEERGDSRGFCAWWRGIVCVRVSRERESLIIPPPPPAPHVRVALFTNSMRDAIKGLSSIVALQRKNCCAGGGEGG